MIDKNIKIFGICLGMQLLLSNSDEGNVEGLNLIEGEVKSLKSKDVVNVPNIGWRKVNFEIDSLSEFNNEYFYLFIVMPFSQKPKIILLQKLIWKIKKFLFLSLTRQIKLEIILVVNFIRKKAVILV